jgi:cephalosporin-C deacetylase
MAYFDFPLEKLQQYKPILDEPQDFDSFWELTLTEVKKQPLEPIFEPVNFGLKTIDVFDVSFNGFGKQTIKAWLLLPQRFEPPLPCIVEYIGYGGGRGFPIDWLNWSALGYAHFVMDTRGQGSAWLKGDTPDIDSVGSSPQYPGFMTRGIFDPKTYYYRRLITDAVRAIETARSHQDIDPDRIIVTGKSQGGGLALIMAGLDQYLAASMPDVPFLCHYRRAMEITDKAPYNEITHFCQVHRDKLAQVFQTLSYFDGVHFAKRARTNALFSVALMDETCPPSTVFAAYNHYAGSKKITVYEFNNHEGGDSFQTLQQMQYITIIF